MLTKKALKTWLNYTLLAITLACIVAALLMDRLSLGEKAVAVAGFLAALRAVLPEIKKQGVEAIDGLDLPECEPQDSTAAPGTRLTIVQAAPLPSTTPTPVTTSIRPPDKGSVATAALCLVTLMSIAGLVAIILCGGPTP